MERDATARILLRNIVRAHRHLPGDLGGLIADAEKWLGAQDAEHQRRGDAEVLAALARRPKRSTGDPLTHLMTDRGLACGEPYTGSTLWVVADGRDTTTVDCAACLPQGGIWPPQEAMDAATVAWVALVDENPPAGVWLQVATTDGIQRARVNSPRADVFWIDGSDLVRPRIWASHWGRPA